MDQVANWRIEDAVALIVQGLIDHAKPYDVETDPAKARTAMETLLHRGGIPAPWSLSAILDTEHERWHATSGLGTANRKRSR